MLQGRAWSFACIAAICIVEFEENILSGMSFSPFPFSLFYSFTCSHSFPLSPHCGIFRHLSFKAQLSPSFSTSIFLCLALSVFYFVSFICTSFSALSSDPATSSQPLVVHSNVTHVPSPTKIGTSVTSFRYSSACLIIYSALYLYMCT